MRAVVGHLTDGSALGSRHHYQQHGQRDPHGRQVRLVDHWLGSPRGSPPGAAQREPEVRLRKRAWQLVGETVQRRCRQIVDSMIELRHRHGLRCAGLCGALLHYMSVLGWRWEAAEDGRKVFKHLEVSTEILAVDADNTRFGGRCGRATVRLVERTPGSPARLA